jgi:hypothetical protein
MSTRDPWLLHFTHVSNVRGIAKAGLLADAMRPDMSVECAEPGIKERRRRLEIPIGPKGVVADYVPFYFAPRSPMLHRIHRDRVNGYQQGQGPLVYLVTRLSRIIAAERRWVATNQNAAVAAMTRFTDNIDDLPGHVDWKIMEVEYWNNTPEDGSRMQRRMAELLVHEHVPWTSFSHVYTHDEEITLQVRRETTGNAHQPLVAVRGHWYF